MKLRAVLYRTVQCGPEDWTRETRVLDVTEDTTVGEIVAWHHRIINYARFPRPVFFDLEIQGEPATGDEP